MNKFTDNFKYEEMIVSKEHPRHAKLMLPSGEDCEFIYLLCLLILEPVRAYLNAIALPKTKEIGISINSCYRDHTLNNMVGGSPGSLHQKGKAVDFTTKDKALLLKAFDYINSALKVSELILYKDNEGNPRFIHVALPVWGKKKYVAEKYV